MFKFDELYAREEVFLEIDDLEPRLASWDAKEHPNQIRLAKYISGLMQRVTCLPEDVSLCLELQVDVKIRENLFRGHDIENYLTPLFGTTRFQHHRFPFVIGSKKVGGGSILKVGSITRSKSLPDDWKHLSLDAGAGAGSKPWKERIYKSVELTKQSCVPKDQLVEMIIALRCTSRRNWVNLWKPTGDALGPILGCVSSNKFNPLDDRISSVSFHRFDDDSLTNDVQIGVWWRSAELTET